MATDTKPGFDAEPIESDETKAKRARAEAFDKNAPTAGALLREALPTLQARASKDAKPIPVPWPMVGEALGGGLWPGLHVLTGATGTGKTQLALQVAWAAAGAGVPALYVGLELGALDLTARLLALAKGEKTGHTPKWSDLYLGKLSPAELEKWVTDYGPEVEARSIRAEFGPPHGWSFSALYERVRALREANPEPKPGALPLLVVLDFLQAVGAPENAPRMELRERIGKAAYAGRAAARDFGAAVLVLSSVSRDGAKKLSGGDAESVPPGACDPGALVGLGKESGDIEYAADSVLALMPGEYTEGKTPMALAVAKVRAGRRAWCALNFDGSTFSQAAPWWGSTPATKATPIKNPLD